jgi:hypothetical protein
MKVFLASSKESLDDVRKIASWVEDEGHSPLPWNAPEAFLAGEYTMAKLVEISEEVDAAIFIFAEDDKVWYRGILLQQPRDNVLIEYGLFAGALGAERAIICRKGQAKNPGDLEGIIHIDISPGNIHSARERISHWLRNLEKKMYQPVRHANKYIEIAADDRGDLDQEYRWRKYRAKKIDIMGIALSGALTEISNDSEDKLLRKVLLENAQVRMMFLSPFSLYVKQRAVEDGDLESQLIESLRESVRDSVSLFNNFKKLYQNEKSEGNIQPHTVGFLEIRVIDFCPHFTIYRTDDELLWESILPRLEESNVRSCKLKARIRRCSLN